MRYVVSRGFNPANRNKVPVLYALTNDVEGDYKVLTVLCSRRHKDEYYSEESKLESFPVSDGSFREVNLNEYCELNKYVNSEDMSLLEFEKVMYAIPSEDYKLLERNFKNDREYISDNNSVLFKLNLDKVRRFEQLYQCSIAKSNTNTVVYKNYGYNPHVFLSNGKDRNNMDKLFDSLKDMSLFFDPITKEEVIELVINEKDITSSLFGSCDISNEVRSARKDIEGICHCCGSPLLKGGESISINGDYSVCETCADEHYSICDCCEEMIDNDDIVLYDGGQMCTYCADDQLIFCDYCDEYSHESHWEGDYCPRCGNNDYGENIEDQDENASRYRGSISNYSYRPTPLFHKKSLLGYTEDCDHSKLYMGIELEVERGRNRDESVHQNKMAYDIKENYPHVYCKADSSVEKGFEIVTHPCDLDFHLDTMPKILSDLRKEKYISYLVENGASFHIHINKSFFGTGERLELATSKLVVMFDKFWDELYKFSKRNRRQIHWCKKLFTDGELTDYKDSKEVYEKAREKSYRNRHSAINLNNRDTIEFRLWRGSLNEERIIATLLMTQALCEISKTMTIDDILEKSFKELLAPYDKRLDTYCETHEIYK